LGDNNYLAGSPNAISPNAIVAGKAGHDLPVAGTSVALRGIPPQLVPNDWIGIRAEVVTSLIVNVVTPIVRALVAEPIDVPVRISVRVQVAPID
jgi:hypothetical protein